MRNDKPIAVAIIGSIGYTGQELVRYLRSHPIFRIVALTSSSNHDQKWNDLFPNLRLDYANLHFIDHDSGLECDADIFFLATPNDVSLRLVPILLAKGKKIIDLSGSFRLSDGDAFSRCYQLTPPDKSILSTSVYGLTECNRHLIAKTNLVANPGCYPTAALLPLVAVAKTFPGLAAPIFIDAKSGASGAGGRSKSSGLNFADTNENFKAYKILTHQHEPEISEHLSLLTGCEEKLHFVPHLVPMNRGIFTTIYMYFAQPLNEKQVRGWANDFCQDQKFIILRQKNEILETNQVSYTNQCHIQIYLAESAHTMVLTSIIDNLGKGAAGQAIQNANLLSGLQEHIGLW